MTSNPPPAGLRAATPASPRLAGRPAVSAKRGRLLAVASAVGGGKTQAVCRCDVFLVNDSERKLCAVAQGTIRKAGQAG